MTMAELIKSHKILQSRNSELISEITYLKQENEQLRRFIFGRNASVLCQPFLMSSWDWIWAIRLLKLRFQRSKSATSAKK
jgi:hypothetical protein